MLPLLIVMVFGIVEAGWALSQRLEIQHGTREAARLVAVDYGSDAEVAAEVCDRMNFTGDSTTTEITIAMPGGDEVGDAAAVTVGASYDSLTGLLDFAFDGASLESSIDIRLEQDARATLGTGVVQTCAA